MTERQIVRCARRLLQEQGWIQGHGHTVGGYCTWGALVHAAEGYDEPEFRRVVTVLAQQLGLDDLAAAFSSLPITVWNDRPGRTYQEVDAALAALEASLAVPVPVPDGELVCT